MLIRNNTSILEKSCPNYDWLFHPVQCIACKICQSSSKDKVFLPRATGVLTFSSRVFCL